MGYEWRSCANRFKNIGFHKLYLDNCFISAKQEIFKLKSCLDSCQNYRIGNFTCCDEIIPKYYIHLFYVILLKYQLLKEN